MPNSKRLKFKVAVYIEGANFFFTLNKMEDYSKKKYFLLRSSIFYVYCGPVFLLRWTFDMIWPVFQLIKVAFDEEVTPENVEHFRKLVPKLRHPSHVLHHFAFCGQQVVPQVPLNDTKGKNASLKWVLGLFKQFSVYLVEKYVNVIMFSLCNVMN